MLDSKTARWSKLPTIYFMFLVFIFILQINVIRDTAIWKMKVRQMLSISHWHLDRDRDADDILSVAITCNRSDSQHFDICTMNRPTLLDQASLTLFTLGPHTKAQPNIIEKIRPYPLKTDPTAMSYVKEFTLTTSAPPKSAHCDVMHQSPALVFSAAGYNGNFYHEINENILGLFITVNSLFPDQDVILVVTEGRTWWFQKYAELLSAFSPNHKVITTNNLTTTHCFPSATVGLKKHGQLTINPKLLPSKTLVDFHAFMKNAYIKNENDASLLMYPDKTSEAGFESGTLELPSSLSPTNQPLPRNQKMHCNKTSKIRPRLVFVDRKGKSSRVLLNQGELFKVAEEVGFNVHVFEPSSNYPMAKAYRLFDESHVMLGVHGAGLTHFLFLRPGSVVLQVVPLGLDWAAKTYYGDPPKAMGLEYIEYKIEANESSLAWSYGADSLVVKNPNAFHQGNWTKRLVYLKKQNVKIDLIRFRKYLTKAYEKAKIFMNSIGEI